MSKSFVQIENVDMVFNTRKGRFVALQNINLQVQQGEFVTLIGHSGCGKSTLLNLIAGLLQTNQGIMLCAEKEINGPGPERGMVFQNHSLLPWMSCFDNVYLAVERVFGKTETRAQLKQRTEQALERALAMAPKLLLLDEPFGALDALTRAHLQDELMRIVADTRSTVVMVTHDVDEAILLSDRIVMMTNGPAATIGEILDVKLPRPRDRLELADNPQYAHYRSQVMEFLYRKQKHAA
jgi:nitrate/nitrite transport system ATP-binding protein